MQSTFKTLALPLALALTLSACAEQPQATADTTASAPPPAEVVGISGTYELDPKHTDVIAQWSHFGFSNPTLHFGQIEGRIVYDADNIAASSVEASIPLAGLEAYVADFNMHLRSADFFEAERFVPITHAHVMGDIEVMGDGGLQHLRNMGAKHARCTVPTSRNAQCMHFHADARANGHY